MSALGTDLPISVVRRSVSHWAQSGPLANCGQHALFMSTTMGVLKSVEPTGFLAFAPAFAGTNWADVNRRIIQNCPHGRGRVLSSAGWFRLCRLRYGRLKLSVRPHSDDDRYNQPIAITASS